MRVHYGSKYYTYKREERYAFRPIEEKDGKILVRNVNNKVSSFVWVPETFLSQMTVEVIPDALLNVMITEYQDGKRDVYVWVFRMDAIAANNLEAALMLRQDTISYLKNEYLNNTSMVYVGECLTAMNNPTDDKLLNFAEYDKIVMDHSISVYLSDTTKDILELFPKKFLTEVDSTLKELTKFNSTNVQGYCSTLEELFNTNDFIANFRSIFNIQQVDYNIILGPESYDENGDIVLNSKQKKHLEDMLRKNITNITVIEYDHDIDLKNIVDKKHILLSDKSEKIFLITYDVIGNYPVESDIAEAMAQNE